MQMFFFTSFVIEKAVLNPLGSLSFACLFLVDFFVCLFSNRRGPIAPLNSDGLIAKAILLLYPVRKNNA